MVVSADSAVAARKKLDTLPFVSADIVQVELVELTN